jgi:hypothetical protein
MCRWRFRIDLQGSEAPATAVLAAALDGQPARVLSVSVDHVRQRMTGDIVIDVPHGDGVGAILSALHEISPRVLIGREEPCEDGLAMSAGHASRAGRLA